MDWVAILGAIGIPTLLGTIIPFLITRHFNKKDKEEEEEDTTGERLNKVEEDLKNGNECFTKEFKVVNDSIISINKILVFLTSAEQALLRDRIIQMYNYYYNDKKYMPIYARESLDHMYKEYKNLGGNGVIDALIDKLYSLPTEPIDLDDI